MRTRQEEQKQNDTLCNNIMKYMKTLNNDNLNEILLKLCYYKRQSKYSIDFNINGNITKHILSNKKFKTINDITFINLCVDDANLYDELINSGKTKPSLDQLILACKNPFTRKRNIILIQKILEKKIIPTHECFLESNKKIKFDNIEFNYPDFFSTEPKTSQNIINLLINFGLTLNLEDVKLLAEHSIEVDIKKFDITPDDKLVNICLDRHFFPQYLDNVKINECQLHNLFLSNPKLIDIHELDKFIQKHHLTCDIICLQNACIFKNNNLVIKYLLQKQHITPDITCAKNIIKEYHINSIVKAIINALPE
jgi:hypothetical protein